MEQSSGSIKVVLHGFFKQLCPVDHTFFVSTPAEALKALFTQVKAFQPKPGKPRYEAQIVGFDDPGMLFMPTDRREIHVVPSFAGGGGNGGFIKIVLGVVLIAIAIWQPELFPLVLGSTGFEITASAVFFSGVMMVAGGLLDVMSAAPKNSIDFNSGGQGGNPASSKYLGTPPNTVAIGTRIPILVGTHKVSGHYLSFAVQATDVSL